MEAIVIPAVIVAAIGLIAGIILTIASKLMFVPVDERVAAIEEILPGANCGACGFAGCADYAAALGNDSGMSTSLCPVGGPDVAAKIAGIMGSEAGEVEERVAMVMCNGTLDATRQIGELKKTSYLQIGEDVLRRKLGLSVRMSRSGRLRSRVQVRCCQDNKRSSKNRQGKMCGM